jgi:periplasmic divalent cation tolerance protein
VKPVIVLTTVGLGFDARALSRELVDARLAGCVNIVDRITSVYSWEGRVEEDGEQLLLIKTVEENLDELQKALFAKHPYAVPEFVVVAIDDIRGKYGEWLRESVSRGGAETRRRDSGEKQ